MPSRPRQFSVLPVRFRVVRMESSISVSHIVMGADIIERDIVGELKRSAVEYPEVQMSEWWPRVIRRFGEAVGEEASTEGFVLFNPDCPLATLQPMNDRRSGGIGPQAGEPGAFSAWHAEHEAVLGGISVPEAADGQHQAMQGEKRVLDSGAHHGLTEQAHQVAGQHGKAQCRFGGPEVLHFERIQAKVRLQLLDPVLTVRPSSAGAPHLHPRQIEAGHESAMAPALDVRIVREQRQCLARPQPEIGHPPRLTWTIWVDIHPNQIPVEGCATPSTATSGFCGG